MTTKERKGRVARLLRRALAEARDYYYHDPVIGWFTIALLVLPGLITSLLYSLGDRPMIVANPAVWFLACLGTISVWLMGCALYGALHYGVIRLLENTEPGRERRSALRREIRYLQSLDRKPNNHKGESLESAARHSHLVGGSLLESAGGPWYRLLVRRLNKLRYRKLKRLAVAHEQSLAWAVQTLRERMLTPRDTSAAVTTSDEEVMWVLERNPLSPAVRRLLQEYTPRPVAVKGETPLDELMLRFPNFTTPCLMFTPAWVVPLVRVGEKDAAGSLRGPWDLAYRVRGPFARESSGAWYERIEAVNVSGCDRETLMRLYEPDDGYPLHDLASVVEAAKLI